jgi:hypothetical protein
MKTEVIHHFFTKLLLISDITEICPVCHADEWTKSSVPTKRVTHGNWIIITVWFYKSHRVFK